MEKPVLQLSALADNLYHFECKKLVMLVLLNDTQQITNSMELSTTR
jgi:hypothetical protein